MFCPREEAERDESGRQIIPYVVLRNEKRYLLMRRTNRQGESRLHDKYSIGVGGHINPEDGRNPWQAFERGMRREIDEEVNVDISSLEYLGILNDLSTAVSRVHIGIVYIASVAFTASTKGQVHRFDGRIRRVRNAQREDGNMVADRDELVEVTLKCPAKVNLFLQVGRKREDGYHEILTIFQTIDLYDELILRPGVSTSFFKSDTDLAWNSSNTLYKAFKAVEKHLGKELALEMELKKKIPTGGGLGGGSSDAAALLRYLGETFHIEREAIFEIACSIGSDVPFFLRGGTAIGTGRGEVLTFPAI
jgi:ADP-ribose pyrophosphatase YjhB (NUDIX family)